MAVINLDRDKKELDPIECFVKETKRWKKQASEAGHHSLVEYIESVLDFIKYAKADSDRLNWLEENPLFLDIKTEDLRSFIDRNKERENL